MLWLADSTQSTQFDALWECFLTCPIDMVSSVTILIDFIVGGLKLEISVCFALMEVSKLLVCLAANF